MIALLMFTLVLVSDHAPKDGRGLRTFFPSRCLLRSPEMKHLLPQADSSLRPDDQETASGRVTDEQGHPGKRQLGEDRSIRDGFGRRGKSLSAKLFQTEHNMCSKSRELLLKPPWAPHGELKIEPKALQLGSGAANLTARPRRHEGVRLLGGLGGGQQASARLQQWAGGRGHTAAVI